MHGLHDRRDHALRLAPTYSDLHALAGEILEAGKYLEGAAAAYANALRLFPKSAAWMNKLRCLRKALGQPELSEATLRGPVALEPTSRVARENLVTMLPAAAIPAAGDARLRFWHAAIGLDDADFFTGQVKPIPNLVSTNPTIIRTPLDAVAGTWRRLMGECRDRAQPGPWRAALLGQTRRDPPPRRHGRRAGAAEA